MDSELDLSWFRSFLSQSRWRFARTYLESYPHEYTLQRDGDPAAFWRAIHCIEQLDVEEPFWSSRRKYLYVDDRKYWHMGDPLSEDPQARPGLINRTWLDVARYRDDATRLGYDDGPGPARRPVEIPARGGAGRRGSREVTAQHAS